jgi:hypothetical protein
VPAEFERKSRTQNFDRLAISASQILRRFSMERSSISIFGSQVAKRDEYFRHMSVCVLN